MASSGSKFLQQTHNELVAVIRHKSHQASENRQVFKRLEALLPNRLKQVRINIAQLRSMVAAKGRTAVHALASEQYTVFIDELVEIANTARLARIEYETHVMLYQARQSSTCRPRRV